MSLRDEVAALVPARPGPRCTIAVVLERLDGDDRRDLLALLADPLVPGSLISRVLIGRGHSVKPPTVNRHRRRMCDCDPAAAA